MNSIYLLSASLVVAGLYIVYLHSVIHKYARWTNMARHALQLAHDCLVEQRESHEANT
jgi:hypothetical protein